MALLVKAVLVTLCCNLISGQRSYSPCYNSAGQAIICEPFFSNIVFGLPIDASHTCGETLQSDDQVFDSQRLSDFKIFYPLTSSSVRSSYCDANSTNLAEQHPPTNMVDLNGSSTWWQSMTLYEYQERGLGDMVQATITLDLGKAYDVTYIRLAFQSPRPESFSIWKKTTSGSEWEPYQYYSSSCLATYNIIQNGPIDSPRRAICTNEYTSLSPLTGGNVAFSTLADRPQAHQFEESELLQEFVTATAIQIRLRRLNTFGNEVFGEKAILQSYYYAISDISVGGRCKCNGHANKCVLQTNPQNGKSRLECQCQHGTTGPDCNQCLETHNDAPWTRATFFSTNTCQECQCNNKSNHCVFNQTLYGQTGSGGYCQNCSDFTDGPHCEKCKPNYFRKAPADTCLECECNQMGALSPQCDMDGQCTCMPGVEGLKCDRCSANYYDFGVKGCKPCQCVEAGSFNNTSECDRVTGQCKCKINVEGLNCDTCKSGYHSLDSLNSEGCSSSLSNESNTHCKPTELYVRAISGDHIDQAGTCLSVEKNISIILNPGQNMTAVKLPNSEYTWYFPEGSYMFSKTLGNDNSIYFIDVSESSIVRRLTYMAKYHVPCSTLKNAYNRYFLKNSLSGQRSHFQIICSNDCNMSTEMSPSYECQRNVLTVYWPTDNVYSVDTKKVPDDLRDTLKKRLGDYETTYSGIVIPTLSQPIVNAEDNDQGEATHLLLISTCADETLTYDAASDSCY